MHDTSMPEVVIIEAGRANAYYWRDLWRFRELLYFLARRDVTVRYKQTVIGLAWSVVRPVLTMLVFTLIFGRIAKLPSEGVPYSLLVFTGMLPWFFFSAALSDSSNSLIANGNLLSKIYFPRLLIPLSTVFVALVDFAIGLVVLLIMMVFMGYPPSFRVFLFPVFMLLALGAALGLGFWFSALNVKYRDLQIIVPFMLQFGLYVSPIGFASTVIPEKWRLVYALNPMVGVIEGFRWVFLGDPFAPKPETLAISVLVVTSLLLSGFWFFRRSEHYFADVL